MMALAPMHAFSSSWLLEPNGCAQARDLRSRCHDLMQVCSKRKRSFTCIRIVYSPYIVTTLSPTSLLKTLVSFSVHGLHPLSARYSTALTRQTLPALCRHRGHRQLSDRFPRGFAFNERDLPATHCNNLQNSCCKQP